MKDDTDGRKVGSSLPPKQQPQGPKQWGSPNREVASAVHLERGCLGLVEAAGQRLGGAEVDDDSVLDGLRHHLIAQPDIKVNVIKK